jgi:DNA invertase Pin-like site-specific DNA recombinase
MSVAVYVRVSTASQNEVGQKDDIKRWLDGNQLPAETVLWFIDKTSGDTLDRPAFEKLQSSVFNGEVSTIVVWKLDRLSRSLRDGLTVLCDWIERRIRIVSVTQQIDLNGTLGKLLASVLLAFAEMEQETRRERQAVGIRAARERGVYKGRKPGSTKAAPLRALKLRKERNLSDQGIADVLKVSLRTVQRYLRIAEKAADR